MQPLIDQNIAYRKTLVHKADDHGYSLITLANTGAYCPLYEEYVTEHGYECFDRLTLQLGNWPYEVMFFDVKGQ